MARQALGGALPLLLAATLGALWPLSAYAFSPLLLPAALVCGGLAALVAYRPEYGIAAALAMAPFLDATVPTGTGSVSPFHLLLPVLSVGLAGFGLVWATERREAFGRLEGAVGLFVAAALMSSILALDPSEAVNKTAILLTGAGIFFAVILICRDRSRLVVVVGGLLLGLALASGHGVAQAALGVSGSVGFVTDSGRVVTRIQGYFEHPNQFGGFVALLVPLAVAALATRASPAWLRLLSAAALALAVPALVLSFTRGAIIGIVIGSLVWLAVVRPRVAVVLAVALGISAFTVAPDLLRERLTLEGHESEVTLRADIWNAALAIYGEHPVIGVGTGNFAEAYARLPSTLAGGSQRRLLHGGQLLTPVAAQNLYLNVLAEMGTIGFIAFLALLIAAFQALYRGSRLRRDPLGRAICLGAGAGVTAFALHNLVDTTLFQPTALPFFAMVALAAQFVAIRAGEIQARK